MMRMIGDELTLIGLFSIKVTNVEINMNESQWFLDALFLKEFLAKKNIPVVPQFPNSFESLGIFLVLENQNLALRTLFENL